MKLISLHSNLETERYSEEIPTSLYTNLHENPLFFISFFQPSQKILLKTASYVALSNTAKCVSFIVTTVAVLKKIISIISSQYSLYLLEFPISANSPNPRPTPKDFTNFS